MLQSRITPEFVTKLKPNEIFVFGSNLYGQHVGGAAAMAVDLFGAVWGQGTGLQGQSYAIPTMQGGAEDIRPYAEQFVAFAKEHPELDFLVTPVGCGIAGLKPEDVAPLFADTANLPNVALPKVFWECLY